MSHARSSEPSVLDERLSPGLRFRIKDWAVSGADLPASGAAPSDLPALLRRRVSPIGQHAFEAAWRLRSKAPTRFIFSSRHGEFDRTLRLLRALVAGQELSPADFNLSVANALAGLLATAAENTTGHSALAAGSDSFGFGLLEAAACIASGEDQEVLLVYFDDLLAGEYAEIAEGRQKPLALAVLMGAPRGDDDDVQLSLLSAPARATHPTSDQAGDFLRFLVDGKEVVSIGRRIALRCSYAVANA